MTAGGHHDPAGASRPRAHPIPAEAPGRPRSAVDRGLGGAVTGLGHRGLAGRRRGPARLLQPGPQDDQRAGWPRRNRPVDHDRSLVPGGRVSAPDRRGPDRRPGASPPPARRHGPVQHRHRRIPRTRSPVDSAVWPAFVARRAPPRPLILSGYGCAAVTAVFLVLLGWLVIQTQGGAGLGLAERLTPSAETCWPFVVAVALRDSLELPLRTSVADGAC